MTSEVGERRIARRRGWIVVAVVSAVLAGLVVPAGPGAAQADDPDPVAFGPRLAADEWRAATDEWLAYATGGSLNRSDPMSIIAFAERARRDPTFVWDPTAPQVADFAAAWNKLDNFEDTGDFTINALLHLYLVAGDQLDPALRQEIVDHVLSFKYWWTEPTPPGLIDDQNYWSENHQAIFLANEYIAGQTFPDEVFTNNGMTGVERMAHARPLMLRWFALRARFGFSEWFSNTYWIEDFMAMILLAEYSEDPVLARYAAATLDIMFVELASHLHEGWFAPTHGRTTIEKKVRAISDSTFPIAQLVLDDTDLPYHRVDRTAQLVAATRYVPPAVVREIAGDDSVHVVRQRQSIPLDGMAPVDPDAVAPYGLSYDDPTVWWPAGAYLSWQIVPLTVDMITTYDLWDTLAFQQAAALRPIVETSTIPELQELARTLAPAANAALLSEVDTYTWRSPEVMLSTAQDFRPGQRAGQQNTWQATLDEETSVFTGLPGAALGSPSSLRDAGGYWTDGAMPKSVQHHNVGISIYAPQYVSTPGTGIPFLEYQPFTNAWFPQDRFDEVVQGNGWTIGRKGDGYVALWSWRPTSWRVGGPMFGMSQPYDLRALGGPDNVWIVEAGRAADWAGPDPFAAFVAAVTAAPIEVVPLDGGLPCPSGTPGCVHGIEDGFDVRYVSPTRGTLTSGWTAPLTVDGAVVDVHGGDRIDSPWATVGWGDLCYSWTAGGVDLQLDLSALEPLITGPSNELGESICGYGETGVTTTTTTTTVTGPGSTDTTSPSTAPSLPPTSTAAPATAPAAIPRFTG